jgi:hypothetical protein
MSRDKGDFFGSFIGGMARALDLGATIGYPLGRDIWATNADASALKSDWEKVGGDLSNGVSCWSKKVSSKE